MLREHSTNVDGSSAELNMLHAASPADLGFVRRVLREGAADGSFDAELAGTSAAAEHFFVNLEGALRCGYLQVPDTTGTLRRDVHAAGYVYSPQRGSAPVGFGLFKELRSGSFELWLTGVAAEERGHGYGHSMLGELLATPIGQMTYVVRCNRRSSSTDIALRLFRSFDFALCRATPGVLWLVNAKAPPEFVTLIANSPIVSL